MRQANRVPGLVSENSRGHCFGSVKRALTAAAACALALFVIATGLASSASARPGSTSRLDEARRQQLQKKAELEALRKSEAELEAALQEIQSRLSETQQRLQGAIERHEKTKAQVAEVSRRIAGTEARVRQISFLAKSRLVEIYKHPDGGLVDALLVAESIGEAGRRTGLVTRVTRADRDKVSEYLSLVKDLSEDKATLEALEAEAARARDEVEAEQRRLEEQQVALEATRAEKERRIAELIAEIDELAKEESRIQSLLAGASRGSARGPTGTVAVPGGRGKFGWPVGGVVTSGFGQRCLGSSCRMHTGIDISAPVGTPVGASAAGTVIAAGYQGAYGNTVVIDHGDGFSTLYAHLDSVSVSSGQRVGRGTIVGTVGTTGNSTGPHLHFEIRYNGAPQDPMAYL